jgi:hypothetical protein
MPPDAIARSVWVLISVSPRRSRNSIDDAGGNFGAAPKPPLARSYERRSPSTASSSTLGSSSRSEGRRSAPPRSRSAIRAPPASISSRRSSHACDTASRTERQLGMPMRDSGGK